MVDVEFKAFPKIPRLNREVICTEKIDGTNATVYVDEDGNVMAGSRKRWITPEDDNFGFAAWVRDHEDELRELGPGMHRGEWWGQGIQRKYDLDEKRFSLFNVSLWGDERPACCHVVPRLGAGVGMESLAQRCLGLLRDGGSYAAPGFMQPEGIVLYHTASGHLYKVLLENDEIPKSRVYSAPQLVRLGDDTYVVPA